jgi:electron-transferring-flavoprotein dehydrogenase
MPPFLDNRGTFTVSLGNFCRWLAGQAEELGVEIFPGFAAADPAGPAPTTTTSAARTSG